MACSYIVLLVPYRKRLSKSSKRRRRRRRRMRRRRRRRWWEGHEVEEEEEEAETSMQIFVVPYLLPSSCHIHALAICLTFRLLHWWAAMAAELM
jgi:hypothetical protein